MISEMNNVDELFRQNMTEFLQTDIDGHGSRDDTILIAKLIRIVPETSSF
jgi:hypothetical protein